MEINFRTLFATLPVILVDNLERSFFEILSNYKEGRFEPSELNGGKFCEIVYRILEFHTDPNNNFTPLGGHIHNFKQSCRKFEPLTAFPESIRFHIPDLLIAIYTIRNKRGVGHVGGEIDPNEIDSHLILNTSKWVLCELVRIFFTMDLAKARQIVDEINAKEIPLVYKVFDKKRVLIPDMITKDKVLLILYSEYPRATNTKDLQSWTEFKNPTNFVKLIVDLHRNKLVEYDKANDRIIILPPGIDLALKKIQEYGR